MKWVKKMRKKNGEKVIKHHNYLPSWPIKILFYAALFHFPELVFTWATTWGFANYHKYHHNRNSKPIDELHDPPLRQLQAPQLVLALKRSLHQDPRNHQKLANHLFCPQKHHIQAHASWNAFAWFCCGVSWGSWRRDSSFGFSDW